MKHEPATGTGEAQRRGHDSMVTAKSRERRHTEWSLVLALPWQEGAQVLAQNQEVEMQEEVEMREEVEMVTLLRTSQESLGRLGKWNKLKEESYQL